MMHIERIDLSDMEIEKAAPLSWIAADEGKIVRGEEHRGKDAEQRVQGGINRLIVLDLACIFIVIDFEGLRDIFF